LNSRPESIVYILPVGLPEEVGVAEDWRKTGKVITKKDGETIQKGMYQYSFGEGDINILRNSLIGSLKESQSFRDVIYLNIPDINTSGSQSAVQVHLKINKTGMASGTNSRCLISGNLILKDEKESTLFQDDIIVESNSLWSIGDAKNKAIKQFVKDVLESFNKF